MTTHRATKRTKRKTAALLLTVFLMLTLQSNPTAHDAGPSLPTNTLSAFGLGNGLRTVVQFMPPDGSRWAYELVGMSERVNLDPRWHQAALVFVGLGFSHIFGVDHLLFLFCLVIPFRRLRSLLMVVTGFTVAHSVTLVMAAYELGPTRTWFPPLVETLIAASIVYMALENIVGGNLRRRGILTLAFGLVHGFGFSFALRETFQLAGSHLLVSVLSFNIGVELGQILVLVVTVPALALLFRHVVAERLGTILLSVLIAYTGWHWMSARAAVLWQIGLPVPDAVLLVTFARGLVLLMLAGGAVWFLTGQRWRRPATQTPTSNPIS